MNEHDQAVQASDNGGPLRHLPRQHAVRLLAWVEQALRRRDGGARVEAVRAVADDDLDYVRFSSSEGTYWPFQLQIERYRAYLVVYNATEIGGIGAAGCHFDVECQDGGINVEQVSVLLDALLRHVPPAVGEFPYFRVPLQ
ncbi:hypothetical protein ACM64Y_14445 [Novispirillum sp. DQ9]|uniref:hypothetical protein n=1 Tax=Novispirillum sp. DQ9 TaxID=3398612 RepID=UPI003C7C316E